MFDRIVAHRLKHYAEQCRLARLAAADPLTQRELAHFETLFKKLADKTADDVQRDSAL
jgi:hypothetical protein